MDRTVLVGCGGVSRGWAQAVRALPIAGRLEAVDMQSFRKENIGPYSGSSWDDIGTPKAELMRQMLEPRLQVTPRNEPLDFYKIRLDQQLVAKPRLVVAGLDDIPPRHAAQRLWPDVLIDMAAGGTTTQLITYRRGAASACVLEALIAPEQASDFAEQMAVATGLSAERIRSNPTSYITEADVASAPQEFRPALEVARRERRLVCGRVTDHNLHDERYSAEFAPAVPFVARLSGIFGAAATMRALMGTAVPLHHQFEFRSFRSRVLRLERSPACECARRAQSGVF